MVGEVPWNFIHLYGIAIVIGIGTHKVSWNSVEIQGIPWDHWFHRNGPLTRYENCGLRMRRECRERFPRHRLQRKPLVSDLGRHHGTCVTHVPWCMSGSLIRGGGENVPGIPGACATRKSAYLVRGPLRDSPNLMPQAAPGISMPFHRTVHFTENEKLEIAWISMELRSGKIN